MIEPIKIKDVTEEGWYISIAVYAGHLDYQQILQFDPNDVLKWRSETNCADITINQHDFVIGPINIKNMF